MTSQSSVFHGGMNRGYRMELRDIEYFTVVAQYGHLGRAAEALGLSQPALSKSLRRLEDELGAKLVKRTPRGVELSAEGLALLGRSRDLHLSLQGIVKEIRDVGRGRVGHARVGVGPTSSAEMVSEALLSLLKDAPGLSYNVVVSDNDLMVPALRRGELDLIVCYQPRALPRDGLVEEHLFDEQFVVIASANHPLAGKKTVSLDDLTHERWVLSESSLLAPQRLRRAFVETGLPEPRVAVETRSLRLRLQLVASSTLLDYTSLSVFRAASTSIALKVLPVHALAWRRPVGIVYREHAYLSPAAQQFIAAVKTTAARRSDVAEDSR